MQALGDQIRRAMPRPTMQFRRRSWNAFQRALDPFAQPRPLRQPRRRAV
jgi:hypothetical protein